MSPSPAWLEWGTAAFSRAASHDRPVFLLVTTWWAGAGRELERTTLADPAIVETIDARFVPVRVDADRRPDIGERYTLGGWPTISVLTPLGHPLGGGTFIGAARLGPLLSALAETYRLRRNELACETLTPPWARGGEGVAAPEPDQLAAEWLVSHLLEEHDAVHGGFGQGGKRMHATALRVALGRLHEGRDEALARVVTSTLEAIDTRLAAPDAGGVYRATAASDWSHADQALLLEVQAEAVGLFLDAWRVLGEARWRARAAGAIDFVRRVLSHRSGGGFAAAALDGEVDRAIYVDANCRMARALLHAAAMLDSPALAEDAIGTIERIVPAAYERNAGLAHSLDPAPRTRGLLGDQVAAAAALLDATTLSAQRAYADLAEELMRSALRRLWNAPHRALRDRVHSAAGGGDVGWLAMPHEPLALNCEAASVLAQLARLTGDATFQSRAVDILCSFAREWRSAGLDGACYPLAAMDALRAQA